MTIASALRPALCDSTPRTPPIAIAMTTIEMMSSISVTPLWRWARTSGRLHETAVRQHRQSKRTDGDDLVRAEVRAVQRIEGHDDGGGGHDAARARAREHLSVGELHARGPRGVREIAAAALRGLLARLIAAGGNRHT